MSQLQKLSKAEIYNEKERLCKKLFGGVCGICKKPFGKGFVYHHIEYGPDSPYKEDPFYFNKLFMEIERYGKKRFCCIHNSHHQLMSRGLLQMSNKNYKRFMIIVNKTRRCQRIE